MLLENVYLHKAHLAKHEKSIHSNLQGTIGTSMAPSPKAVKQKKFDFYYKLLWRILSPF